MATYVIADIEITDPQGYEEYRKMAARSLEMFGGRFLVRGGTSERLEGHWSPHRVVVLEFPTHERAREWYASEEYREPKLLRKKTAKTDMILVEGV